MPFLLFFTQGWMRYAVLAAVLSGLILWGCEHLIGIGEARTQVKFDAYVADVKAKGLQAALDNKTKENGYAQQILAANSGRDDALGELRKYTAAHPPSRASTNNPTATAGSTEICIESATFNAAFKRFGEALDRFIQDARRYVTAGDEAQIDAVTLLNAWPTDKRTALDQLINLHAEFAHAY